MFCHLTAHVVAEYLTIHTQSFTATATVQLQLNILVFVALPEFLGFLADLYPLMLGGQFGCMVFLVALHTEMGVLCDAVVLGIFRRIFVAVLAERCFGLLFFFSVNNVVDNVDGKDLIVLEDDILMLEDLRVLVLVVEIDGLETFGAGDGLVDELILAIAVRFPHRYLVHDTRNVLLRVSDAVEAHVEYHSRL